MLKILFIFLFTLSLIDLSFARVPDSEMGGSIDEFRNGKEPETTNWMCLNPGESVCKKTIDCCPGDNTTCVDGVCVKSE